MYKTMVTDERGGEREIKKFKKFFGRETGVKPCEIRGLEGLDKSI